MTDIDPDALAGVLASVRSGPIFEGLFSGRGEPEAIEHLIEAGVIRRNYNSPAGLFVGVAKIELVK